jgi:hypothetical protein
MEYLEKTSNIKPVLQYSNFLYLKSTLSINCNPGLHRDLPESALILPVNLHMV